MTDPQPFPQQEPADDDDYTDDGVNAPFVPRPKYRMGKSTRIMAGVLLVAVGFLGGVAVNKAVDGGQARSSRSQFLNSGQTGFGGTQQGTGTRQRGSGAGTGTGAGTGAGTSKSGG